MRAYRRRRAGVPESFAPEGGLRGRLSLAENYEREQIVAVAADLEAARRALVNDDDWRERW
jgi:hypothetical protein